MKHGLFSWQENKTDVRAAVVTFLLGGPALLGPCWIVMSWHSDVRGGVLSELIAIPLLAPVGLLSWWNWLLQPRMALLTWVPTLAAGVISGYSLHLLSAASWYQQVRRVFKLAQAAIICAVISALVYEATWRISGFIGAMPSLPQSSKFFARDGGVPIVTAIGFLLGAFLAWRTTGRIPPRADDT